MTKIIRSLGLGIGASTVTIVQVEQDTAGPASRPRVRNHAIYPHEGNPRRTMLMALEQLDLDNFDTCAATGRKFRTMVNITSIPEPEAVEYAYRYIKPPDIDCPALISAGGETFMMYRLDRSGRITDVVTGNKCAAGTGEFFLQQLRRMNVSLDESARWAAVENPYRVSGRCSVFCKSDCTHATNKGIPKSQVTAGLCRMMAEKILELLKKIDRQNLMITGGTTQNSMMIDYLRREIPGLIVPPEAPYFEALGAALWALDHETSPLPGWSNLFKTDAGRFDTLPPLSEFRKMVEFKALEPDHLRAGDECILGLDVGSTTTKAILLRIADDALLASVYLRTNGDPVEASRQCYRSILHQIRQRIDPARLDVLGLGVCGSGRQIAGLHALTDGIINEIIAHATAAIHFDSTVDTIFEIGGQDAKYTYITNGVPSDYAMNEACSAGTGSFLEESAFETLGINMEDIAGVAIRGETPPNFNDQCAAFIASDIKNAIHEGVSSEDIVAGLVYSICMNYTNRVKGNRPVGQKVFMQGGVCYNTAVPLAMASLVGKPIVVPPEPGLMGAFGVALEVKKRIETGLQAASRFDLESLSDRKAIYGKTFTCNGGKEACDRRCTIAMIQIEGKSYPFGGACNRYYNLRHKMRYDVEKLDLIKVRQKLVFGKYAPQGPFAGDKTHRGKIGLNRSLLVNTYYPLYSTFFSRLGYEPVLPKLPSRVGIDQRNAAFCHPVELAHGFFYSLLTQPDPPRDIFLPHFKAVPRQTENPDYQSQVCPLVQGEPYYLRATFKHELVKRNIRVLSPLIDLSDGLENARKPLIKTAMQIGSGRKAAGEAFEFALRHQIACRNEMKAIGSRVMAELETNPARIAMVIFSRPYNGWVDEGHMGIPNKFASRGVQVIPSDFLPADGYPSKRHMFWGMGQRILKTARFVKDHPQLFGTYITNFSCGPDSFLLGYFRDIMGRKPSLTLELDSHTADAGLDNRIEAFLDIVNAYRKLAANRRSITRASRFMPARTVLDKTGGTVITSSGKPVPMTDPRVTVLLPSMGKLETEAFAAVLKAVGLNTMVHRPADEAILKIGRSHTSCKECLPLILTTGTLISYIVNCRRPDEVLTYFMPTGSGPCRFGQYSIFMEDLIRRLEIPDVALLALTSANSYVGMSNGFETNAWLAIVVADVMEDIRSMLLANAVNKDAALTLFDEIWKDILRELTLGEYSGLEKRLKQATDTFLQIPMMRPPRNVPIITLTGEIFVRRDSLSRQFLTERLAEKGFATHCAPVAEWILYCNYMVEKGLGSNNFTQGEKMKMKIRNRFMSRYESRIKALVSRSGLIHSESLNIPAIIRRASPYISQNLPGEAILTIGGAMSDIASHSCGVIAIGPFGCMPNRLSEAILNETMNREEILSIDPKNSSLRAILTEIEALPFLAVESDGSPFPQLIDAKLEAFCLRAERLHRRMQAAAG